MPQITVFRSRQTSDRSKAEPNDLASSIEKSPAAEQDVAGAADSLLLQHSTIQRSRVEFYHGPIPPAEEIARYEAVVPGAGKIILENAVTQMRHRQRIELITIRANVFSRTLGQVLTGASVAGVLYVAVLLIHTGQTLAGLSAVVSALAILGGVFVYAEKARKEERVEKTRIMAGEKEPSRKSLPGR